MNSFTTNMVKFIGFFSISFNAVFIETALNEENYVEENMFLEKVKLWLFNLINHIYFQYV